MKAVSLPNFSPLGLVVARASRQQRPLLRTAPARPCAPCQSYSTPDSAVGIPTPPEPTASCPASCCDSGQDSSEPSGSASPRTAWNKGHAMPAATRRKLSQALKQRWKDPERRAAATAKLKGIEPWNKGRTLSEETRAKMRAAKLGRTVSKATRRRMSVAHRGKTHSQDTVDLLSDMALGRPKTQEHKMLIASGQRRRHAAARVLRAVESVYEAQAVQDSCNGGGASGGSVTACTAAHAAMKPAAPGTTQPGSIANGARGPVAAGEAAAAATIQTARLAAYRNAAGGVAAAGGSAAAKTRKLSMAQILGEYKAELREYRALQEELSPWSTAFLEKHGRKPGMQDVVATGIPWLIMRYKQYILLRDRLFTDTGTLRQRLHSAIPDSENGVGSINRAGALSMGPAGGQQALAGPGAVNANGVAGARSSAANRFSAAMEYKAARGRSNSPAGSRSSIGGSGGNSVAPAVGAQQAPQRQGAAEVLHPRDVAGAVGALGMLGTPEPENMSGDEDDLQDALPGPNVPPRVRLAMMAAQEYRKKKAQATKALAAAAAAAAKAGPAGAAKAAVAVSSASAGEVGGAAASGRAGA